MAAQLSEQARRRLARPAPAPLSPPPLDDHAAVAAWRTTVHAAWLAGDPPAAACGHHQVQLGGVRCLRRPNPGAPVVLYLHGGGYALGSPEVALPITERLGAAVEVVSVDYRLGPEHPYPAGLHDCRAVHDALRGADPARPLVLAGDSAGANLAVSLALGLDEPPAALVLLSPHLDHSAGRRPGPGVRRGPGDDVDAAAAAWLTAAYCGDRDPADPAVSPLHADLAGLPPTLVQAGGDEPLRPQATELAARARRDGVDVTLDIWDGMWHTWHYHRDVPEADRALEAVGDFVLAAAAA